MVGVLADLDVALLEESVSCGDGIWQGVNVVYLILLPSCLDELVVCESCVWASFGAEVRCVSDGDDVCFCSGRVGVVRAGLGVGSAS